MNGDHSNAVAGPSTLPSSLPPLVPHQSPSLYNAPLYPSDSPPLLFLPPPGPPPPRLHLAATQDLLARFNLLPSYDRYVRPAVLPGDDPALQPSSHQQEGADGTGTGSATGPDKGKGKAREGTGVGAPADGDQAEGAEAEGEEGAGAKGEKKKKNSYKHLIQKLPGKHSFKKDDYLTQMMMVPPKQRLRIHQFDARTQDDAFTVSLEGIKGWNVNALFVESAQAREDRKKRKELKRLAKLQMQGLLPAHSSVTGTTPTTVGTPQRSSTPVVAQPQPVHASGLGQANGRQTAGTPKPGVGTPRPASRAMNSTHNVSGPVTASSGPSTTMAGVGNVHGTSRPAVPRPKSTVPRPGSTVPRPGSTVSANKPLGSGPPLEKTATPAGRPGTPMDVDAGQRGKKRERDDAGYATGVPQNTHTTSNGMQNGNGNGYTNGTFNGTVPPRPGLMNAKAGTGDIRPRPVKKRKDMQGQAQPVQQQPTPQGV